MWTIKPFAQTAGVGVETVRFYQRKGLLEVPAEQPGGRRYGPADLRRLRFIRQAQTAGFSLQDIAELLALDACEDRSRVRELAQERLQALQDQIRSLQQAQRSLQRLVRECAQGSSGPCPILEAFAPE